MKTQPRQNWEATFQEMHANGDDELLIADVFEDEEFEEYDFQIGAENKD
jgi:antitoxin MazE